VNSPQILSKILRDTHQRVKSVKEETKGRYGCMDEWGGESRTDAGVDGRTDGQRNKYTRRELEKERERTAVEKDKRKR
jgi:hypothetical protein